LSQLGHAAIDPRRMGHVAQVVDVTRAIV
jgi:hypothetical protein